MILVKCVFNGFKPELIEGDYYLVSEADMNGCYYLADERYSREYLKAYFTLVI